MNPPASSLSVLNQERPVRALSGWLMLFITLVLYVAVPVLIFLASHQGRAAGPVVFLALFILALAVIGSAGFFTLQPNGAAVLILFGAYKGTVRDSGFFWTNLFNKKLKLSLRARNLNGE